MKKWIVIVALALSLTACGKSQEASSQEPIQTDARSAVEFCSVLKYNILEGKYADMMTNDLKSRVSLVDTDAIDEDMFTTEEELLSFIDSRFSDFKVETQQISIQGNKCTGSILVSYFNGTTSYYYLDFSYDLASNHLTDVAIFEGMDTKFN